MKHRTIPSKPRWQALLLLLACLLVGSSPTWAVTREFKNATESNTVTHVPTVDEPYLGLTVIYYDHTDGHNGFFMHQSPSGVPSDATAGPALFVDDQYICSPDYELAWPGGGGNGNSDSAKDATGDDDWWGNTYTKTVDGVTYTVMFYNPYKESNAGQSGSKRLAVDCLIFMDNIQLGKTYKVKIAGWWKINNTHDPQEQSYTWTFSGSTMGLNAPTAEIVEYGKIKVSGQLNTDYGPTIVGSYSGATTEGLKWAKADALDTPYGSYAKGQASYSDLAVNFSERADYSKDASKYIEYIIPRTDYTPTGFKALSQKLDIKVYQWFKTTLPNYIKPTQLEVTNYNQWTKQVTLKWSYSGQHTGGTWNIYRYPSGTTNKGEPVATLNYSTTSYATSAPALDTLYTYQVAFIPTNGVWREELSGAKDFNLQRSWGFNELKAAFNEDSTAINLTWTHKSIEDATGSKPYSLVIQRSENYNMNNPDAATWTDIKTIAITSKSTNNGTYTDANNFIANRTYAYRLKVNLLEVDNFSPIAFLKLGGSKITAFSATRGTYNNMVKLEWNVKQVGTNVTNFIIQRRPLGSNDEQAWANIHKTAGTASGYSYDDVTALPGSYNQYKVVVWSQDGDIMSVDDAQTTDGFSLTSGSISGNITFGTGTAVEGAKVTLKQQNAEGEITSGMKSVHLSGEGSGMKYATDNATLKSLLMGDFSIQMYVYPDSSVMSGNNTEYRIFDVEWALTINARYDAVGKRYKLAGYFGGDGFNSDSLYIPAGEWSHMTLVHDHKAKTLTFYLTQAGKTQKEVVVNGRTTTWDMSANADCFAIGNVGSFVSETWFEGYIDEFRFFTKPLTERDILHNYNHPLAGNETGLAIYYPLDEGLTTQNLAYDFSRTNGVSNGRHAIMMVPGEGSSNIPSEDQLSLMSYTDVNGYYEIRGVPFSGEGTSYAVIPSLNIHEFSPTTRSRFVSMSSLNHSGVDFEDISSFPVKGKVLYADSNCPVEGVSFNVDGIPCAKDGSPITTNENGEYEISVPIGQHFITIEKNGHVFEFNGRYPEDPMGVGTRYNFDRAISNLDFYDNTLVNFTGRVVGGSIEGNKPLGFGLSENNIGVTQLVLTTAGGYNLNLEKIKEETSYYYETRSDSLPVLSATTAINSSSWRGANDRNKFIYIQTDPLTGEFSAMVPPLMYQMQAINVMATGATVGDAASIDLTQPLLSYKDSVETENGFKYYEYNTMLRQTYHNPTPTFTVRQDDNDQGAFGISNYEVTDAEGTITLDADDIYTVSNGHVNYAFNAPLFIMADTYTFLLEGYEEYANYDKSLTNPVLSRVPLAGAAVTIANSLSAEHGVYIEGNADGAEPGSIAKMQNNELELDSLGRATYVWKAGYPNISSPHTRTIKMSYDIDGHNYTWTAGPLTGIILGELPTGNDFVTAGPTIPDMILRDPPGSGSSAEWSKGTSKSFSHTRGGVWSSETGIQTTSKLGVKCSTVTGIGVAKLDDLESRFDLKVGTSVNVEGEDASSWGRSITATRTISTSDDADYVGADGDLFIASTSNLVFGLSRNVNLTRIPGTNDVELSLTDGISTGLDFDTEVAYTQKYIIEELIPDLEKLRNSKLQWVSDTASYRLTGNSPVYITQLTPDDERFGSENNDTNVWGDRATPELSSAGPSYKMLIPDGASATDSVHWCNNQIAIWQKLLADNEREKVEAYEKFKNVKYSENDSVRNVSFDSGANVSYSVEIEETKGTSYDCTVSAIVTLGFESGCAINSTGVYWDVTTETGGGEHFADEEETVEATSFSYTFAEEGGDALSVDVYQYGSYSPIFRTRGGQTSAPYEGEVRTSYYQNENGEYPVIMEATMQIEVPDIEVVEAVVSDIPTGSAANFTLRLGNNSEIGADVAYKLFVLDETNPFGAQLSIDGSVLTEGRLIKVPGNQTLTKVLQLRQTDVSVLDYNGNFREADSLYKKGIGIVFASESQPEDIADTIFIKAFFVPSSSPVDLALSKTTMNTLTGTDLTLTFSGFDRNYKGLKAFRLQYKKQGSTDWTLLKEYVTDSTAVTQNNLLLPASGASVSFTQHMASFADGNYVFRVVSASTYGLQEVYRYSNEIALVKDTKRPAPLGQPEPADGVLDIGDELSVTFNEPFLKGELTKEVNFHITGVLNGAEVAHETALSMQGSESTATTDASIMLAKKDFSVDAWVNLNGAGTILSHGSGTNKFTVGTDAAGRLVVSIADSTYTSEGSIPTGKWVFLTLNYQSIGNGGNISATVAGDNTVYLFSGKATVAYEGNGPLTIGKNAEGAIHELLLWDEAHDMTTALMNRSVTKNPSTRHLIGYWKMDEGEGTVIRDYARNRHMTMADETWYLNNENKAINFDGNSYMKLLAEDSPYSTNDDYAIEFWMQGNNQNAEAQLLQAGEVALWLNTDGQLQLTTQQAYNPAGETAMATSSGVLTDNAWHHVALNVLRQGAAAIYVDGKRCLTTNATNVGHIATDNIIVGARRVTFSAELAEYSYDRAFKGLIDEVRIWDATLNGDKLTADRKIRLTGKEDGLVAYYPFEKKQLDSGNQIETVGTDADLTSSDHKAQLYSISNSELLTLNYSDNAPALRTKPTETNVSFNFTASDTKVVIDIDEDAATIAGCTLNFTVRDMQDENGNYSLPVSWSAFVNQNELLWADDALSIELPVETSGSMTTSIVNKSGTQQMWTLSGMPSWLQASTEYGTTNPRSESQVTFTVSAATPIGKYEETVYLKSNNGIETPLTISVNVTGDKPLWSVNAADYEESMNLIGSLYILDAPSEDSDDMVAAFINGECRGVAQLEYKQRFDSYFVTMDIYANASEADAPVEFKAYDASTGIIYPVVKAFLTENGQWSTVPTTVTFEANSLLGRYPTPVKLTATDEVEQNIELAKGWNWVSFGVKPDKFTVENVFDKAGGKVEFVKSNTQSAEFDGEDWLSEITAMNNREMYAVQTNDALTLNAIGHRVNPADEPITVNNGWSWVAFNPLKVMSLGDALADMHPLDDEIIKGQRGVAYYDSYEWNGSLRQLSPGQGYKIFGRQARTFTYPSTTAATAPARATRSNGQWSMVNDQCSMFTPVDYHNYPANMVVIAQVVFGSEPIANAEVGIFAGDECREAAVTDDRGMIYVTVPGNEQTQLHFIIATDGKTMEAAETVTYENDAVCGTPRTPFVIDLGNATAISHLTLNAERSTIFDLQGRRVNGQMMNSSNRQMKGVYIINGQKMVK